MPNLAWLLTGGFAKGYRTQILGLTTALSALAMWATGDSTLTDLIAKAPAIFGGLGLTALGAKVKAASTAAPQKAKPVKAK
jgi:hypothetical protein